MALIDIDYFMSLPLGLKDPKSLPDADKLAVLIETASDQIEDFCDRKFALQAHTEALSGKDDYRLILREYPAVSLTSVAWEDDDTGQTGTIDTTLLRLSEHGILEWKRKGIDWFERTRLYTIVYQAGYATIPGPVQHATALQVTELLQPNYGGPQAETPAIVPVSSQLIVDLLDPKYRRKFKRS